MCDAVVSITPVECGLPWPSGHHAEIASIDVSADVIEGRLGRALLTGVEDGLGPWKAQGFRLSRGEWMELISYEGDVERCFILRVDAGTPAGPAIARFLTAFGLSETCIRWRADAG